MTLMPKTINWDGNPETDYPNSSWFFQETMAVNPPVLCPGRTLKIKRLGEGWAKQSNLHIRVLISVGMAYHTGEYFTTLTDFLNRVAKERGDDKPFFVSYVVGDSLQRWNIARDNPDLTEDKAWRESIARGRRWLERDLFPTVGMYAGYRWQGIEWDNIRSFFGDAEYDRRGALVRELIGESPAFAAAIKADVDMFVKRHYVEKDGAPADARARFEQHSRDYIIEEVGAFSLIPQEPGCVDIYPRGNLEAFQVLQDEGKVQGSAQTQCIVDAFRGRRMGLIEDSTRKPQPPEAIAMDLRKAQTRTLRRFFRRADRGLAETCRQLRLMLPSIAEDLQADAASARSRDMVACARKIVENLRSFEKVGKLCRILSGSKWDHVIMPHELKPDERAAGAAPFLVANALIKGLEKLAAYMETNLYPQADAVSRNLANLKAFVPQLEAAAPGTTLHELAAAYPQLSYRPVTPTLTGRPQLAA